MADFSQLLAKPMDDIKRPEALPTWTYFGVITSRQFREGKTNQTLGVEFTVSKLDPVEGLDETLPHGYHNRSFRTTFWVTDASEWRIKDFLASCGIDTTGRSLGECVEEAVGCDVVVELLSKPAKVETDPNINDITKVIGRHRYDETAHS